MQQLRPWPAPAWEAALVKAGTCSIHSSAFIFAVFVQSLKHKPPCALKPPHNGTLVPSCEPYSLYHTKQDNQAGQAMPSDWVNFCCNREYLLYVCASGSMASPFFIHMALMDWAPIKHQVHVLHPPGKSVVQMLVHPLFPLLDMFRFNKTLVWNLPPMVTCYVIR